MISFLRAKIVSIEIDLHRTSYIWDNVTMFLEDAGISYNKKSNIIRFTTVIKDFFNR